MVIEILSFSIDLSPVSHLVFMLFFMQFLPMLLMMFAFVMHEFPDFKKR